MDRELFRMLTSGAKFDRKRQDNKIFSKKQPEVVRLPEADDEADEDRRRANEEAGASDSHVPLFAGSRATAALPSAGDVKQRMERVKNATERENIFRKAFGIRVKGSAPPAPLEEFSDLTSKFGVPDKLVSNLAGLGFTQPTPVQRQAVTAMLSGREVLAVAPTGSGKTLAFLVPLVAGVAVAKKYAHEAAHVRGVVLSPTRELGGQTATIARLLCKSTGVSTALASRAIEASGMKAGRVDVLIGIPARMAQMAAAGEVDLARCLYVVMDEADKLFEMGFLENIDQVLALAGKDLADAGRGQGGDAGVEGGKEKGKKSAKKGCSEGKKGKSTEALPTPKALPTVVPRRCVRALFSATLPEKVEEMARSVLRDPLRITVGHRNAASHDVSQRLVFVGKEEGKLLALRQLLSGGVRPPVLVFVDSKERAQALRRELLLDGFKADAIHGDQPQASRNAAVDNFRIGRTWVLVATDLVGRGMDFLGVNTVVNYDFPRGTMDYVHRIGRTGRAGRCGEAVTFFMEDDADRLRSIANVMRQSGCEVPAWMLTLKKQRRGHYNAKAGAPKKVAGAVSKKGKGRGDGVMMGATIRAPLGGSRKRRRESEGGGEGKGGDGGKGGVAGEARERGQGAGAGGDAEGAAPKAKKPGRAPKRVRMAARAEAQGAAQ